MLRLAKGFTDYDVLVLAVGVNDAASALSLRTFRRELVANRTDLR